MKTAAFLTRCSDQRERVLIPRWQHRLSLRRLLPRLVAVVLALAFTTFTLAQAQAGESPPPVSSAGVILDLQALVDAALAKGERTIVVPPGRYRVAPRNRECLALRSVKDVQILCDGVEMICTETTRALTIANCENVTVRGLSIDYDPLPFTQGRIVALSADKSVHDIELTEGYGSSATATKFKYEIFNSETRTYRCGEYGIKTLERPDSKHLRITRTNSSAKDPEQVGDIIAIGSEAAPGGSIPHAVYVADSKRVRLEDISVYASNCFAFLEDNCDATTYLRCRVDRRPLADDLAPRADARIRSLNADAFHCICAAKGPEYIECSARFMADDCINICSDYHLVTSCAGAVVRVLSKHRNGINVRIGDSVELLAYNGQRLPDAKVTGIEPDSAPTEAEKQFISKQGMDAGTKEHLTRAPAFRITLDRIVELPMGSALCPSSRKGNGFVVRKCNFGFNRSRGILVKAGDGVIEGNVLTGNVMSAIMVAPEWWWLESGCSDRVKIVDNTIRDCGDIAIAVYAFGGAPGIAPAGAHSNMLVSGNTISDSPLPNILVTSTNGLELSRNTSQSYDNKTAPEWTRYRFGLIDKPLKPVMTIHCDGVREIDAGR